MGYEIMTSDWHIRSTVPSCLDMTQAEWMDLQRNAINQVKELAIHYHADVYVGGDIYHSEQTTSFECIQMVQDFGNDLKVQGLRVFVLPGNHDLPYHSSANLFRSAIGVLLKSECVIQMNQAMLIKGCNFDEDDYGDSKAIFRHVLTVPSSEVQPFMNCETPESLVLKYPSANWIFTGDNHRSFYYQKDGKHVINCGCLTKQASDFEDYDCCVWVVDMDADKVEKIIIECDYHFNHNRAEKKAADEKIQAFADSVKRENVSFDFISSLRNELPEHETAVQDKVNSWIEKIGQ